MRKVPNQAVSVLTLMSLMLFAASTLAFAQSQPTTVSTSVKDGTRQLAVTELVGDTLLTDLTLVPAVPSAFRVNVIDTDYVPTQQFDVNSRLNNLYRWDEDLGSYVDAQHIPSGNVKLTFATNQVGGVGDLLDVLPTYLVSSDGTIDCTLIESLLSLGLSVDGALQLCNYVGDLTGSALTFSDVPVVGDLVEGVDLGALDLADLPLDLLTDGLLPQDGFTYDDPDYSVDTIGEGRGTGTATQLRMLAGRPVAGLSADLLAAINAQLPSLTGDVTDVVGATAIIQALQSSATASVAGFGDTLAGLTSTDAVAAVNGLLTIALEDLGLDDLRHLTGRYMSFPMLTVTPDENTVSGTYRGTLTVQLVE